MSLLIVVIRTKKKDAPMNALHASTKGAVFGLMVSGRILCNVLATLSLLCRDINGLHTMPHMDRPRLGHPPTGPAVQGSTCTTTSITSHSPLVHVLCVLCTCHISSSKQPYSEIESCTLRAPRDHNSTDEFAAYYGPGDLVHRSACSRPLRLHLHISLCILALRSWCCDL